MPSWWRRGTGSPSSLEGPPFFEGGFTEGASPQGFLEEQFCQAVRHVVRQPVESFKRSVLTVFSVEIPAVGEVPEAIIVVGST